MVFMGWIETGATTCITLLFQNLGPAILIIYNNKTHKHKTILFRFVHIEWSKLVLYSSKNPVDICSRKTT